GTDGVDVDGTDGVWTDGTDGVCTAGAGVWTDGTGGVWTGGTGGVCTWGTSTCGTCGTGTLAFGVAWSCEAPWSCGIETFATPPVPTPTALPAGIATTAITTVAAAARPAVDRIPCK
ncbi:MAG: hypothetical protein QOG63_482, partial [Thermoleophilaceae bacterium]|nr:hypothetical protein [Thermoleophilaceae bacterium]